MTIMAFYLCTGRLCPKNEAPQFLLAFLHVLHRDYINDSILYFDLIVLTLSHGQKPKRTGANPVRILLT